MTRINKKKISVFFTGFIKGGGERAMVVLARELKARGHQVELVFLYSKEQYQNTPDDIPAIFLGAGRMISGVFQLRRYLKANKPNALITTQEHGHIIALVARMFLGVRIRVVIRVGIPLAKLFSEYRGVKDRVFVPLFARLLYKHGDACIAVSQYIQEELVSKFGVSRKNVHVIPNPVDFTLIKERTREAADHPWLIHKEAPVILSVGRLEEQKGFDVLVRAFSQVEEKTDARLIIIGNGSKKEELKNTATECGIADRVSLPGYKDNIYAYMARADVFVLSSRWEGFPNALVEAMAVGLPAVATDCISGPREMLSDGKEETNSVGVIHAQYGLLVPPDSEGALAAAIEEMLLDSDMRKQYAQAAAARARDFELARVAGLYEDVLCA